MAEQSQDADWLLPERIKVFFLFIRVEKFYTAGSLSSLAVYGYFEAYFRRKNILSRHECSYDTC